jgi:hypothetical protein
LKNCQNTACKSAIWLHFRATRDENRAKKFEKDTLTGSWAREVRMRNIWKAIDNHTQAANSAGIAAFDDAALDDTMSMASTATRGALKGAKKKPPMGAAVALKSGGPYV